MEQENWGMEAFVDAFEAGAFEGAEGRCAFGNLRAKRCGASLLGAARRGAHGKSPYITAPTCHGTNSFCP